MRLCSSLITESGRRRGHYSFERTLPLSTTEWDEQPAEVKKKTWSQNFIYRKWGTPSIARIQILRKQREEREWEGSSDAINVVDEPLDENEVESLTQELNGLIKGKGDLHERARLLKVTPQDIDNALSAGDVEFPVLKVECVRYDSDLERRVEDMNSWAESDEGCAEVAEWQAENKRKMKKERKGGAMDRIDLGLGKKTSTGAKRKREPKRTSRGYRLPRRTRRERRRNASRTIEPQRSTLPLRHPYTVHRPSWKCHGRRREQDHRGRTHS